MIGPISLVFIFAYGRMSKSFAARSFAILGAIAVGLTWLSLAATGAPIGMNLAILAGVQFVLQVMIYAAAVMFGRWRDRDKGRTEMRIDDVFE